MLHAAYALELTYLPRKPRTNTLLPRVDHQTGERVPEKNPVMMFDHDMYKEATTLQRHREEIYIDVARAVLSSINDLTGANLRSRLYGSRYRGDLKALEASLLQSVMLGGHGVHTQSLEEIKQAAGPGQAGRSKRKLAASRSKAKLNLGKRSNSTIEHTDSGALDSRRQQT